MRWQKQIVLLLIGASLGSLLTIVLAPETEIERFDQLPQRDIQDVADVSVEEAAALREERYESISTIEEILSLPTDFAETEALYAVAGRSDAAAAQDLIYQAARISDQRDRHAALEILLSRLTELDPRSALAISRSPGFSSIGNYEKYVWISWGRLDLNAALAAAEQGTNAEKRLAAQALYGAIRTLDGSDADAIRERLGVRPGRSARAQFLATLAEQSAVDAIRYIEASGSRQDRRELFSVLASYLNHTESGDASTYVDLIRSPGDRRLFEQLIAAQNARSSPETILNGLASGSVSANNRQQVMTALSQLAAEDPAKAFEYIEQLPNSATRQQYESVVMMAMAASDPDAALQWARSSSSSRNQQLLVSVIQQVAQRDPERALEELPFIENVRTRDQVLSVIAMTMGQTSPEGAMDLVSTIANKQMRDNASHQIAAVWAQSDSESAMAWVSSLPENEQQRALMTIGQQLVYSDVDVAIDLIRRFPQLDTKNLAVQVSQMLAQSGDSGAALAFIDRYRGKPEYAQMQASVIGMMSAANPSTAMQMARGMEDSASKDQLIAGIIGQQAAQDPRTALQWMESISSEKSKAMATSQIAAHWYAADASSALAWVDGLPSGEARDGAILSLASYNNGMDDAIDSLIEKIADPDKRRQAQLTQLQRLIYSNPDEVERRMDEYGLSGAERERIEQMMQQRMQYPGMILD